MRTTLYRLFRLALVTPFLVLTLPALAQGQQVQEKPPESRKGRTYVGVLGTALEYRKIGGSNGEEAWGTVGTFVWGSHISELFHVELRAGRNITDTEVTSDLTIELDYFVSWYMGLHYDLTDYANIYAQLGFSHISGEAKLSNPGDRENALFRDFTEDEFPESSFGFSWLAGVDMEVIDNTYFVLEGGRLYEDSETRTQAFQFNSGIRYEF
jgi:opacity protein-like surface antigen